MISCVICSRRPDVSAELKENIAKTIGCDYELVVIDNSKNEYSIFSAYNEGVRRAKGDVLCFMHEDILYHTDGWGEKVRELFNNEQIGAVGVVGSHLLPKTISGWYHPMLISGGCIQNINGRKEIRVCDVPFDDNGIHLIEVVAVDGMWFCIPTKLFQYIQFDQNTFSHFHCYDLDICIQIKQLGLKILVTSDVLLEHTSLGNFDKLWYEESEKLYHKWKSVLPLTAGTNITNEEVDIRTNFVDQVMVWQKAYAQCAAELKRTKESYAYRIGKKITSLAKVLRREK